MKYSHSRRDLLHNLEITGSGVRCLGRHRLRLRQRGRSLHEHDRLLRLAQRPAQGARPQDHRQRGPGRQDHRGHRPRRHGHDLRRRHGVGVKGETIERSFN